MSKDFKPQDYFRYKRLRKRWQKPIGLQSKLRESRKGAGAMPNVGYRTPRKFRGLERGVVKSAIVKSIADLDGVKENEAVLISAGLGKKKVFEIAGAAAQRRIKILNAKSAAAARKRAEQIEKRKEEKAKTSKKEAKKEAKKEETKMESKVERKEGAKEQESKTETKEEQKQPAPIAEKSS